MRFLDPNPNPAGGASTVQGGSPAVLTFKANGAEHTLTLDEVKQHMSKIYAADENMRNAAELRKLAEAERQEAKGALTAKQAVARLREDPSDLEALKVTAEFLGMDGDAVSELARSNGGGAAEGGDFATALGQMKEIPLALLPTELRDLAKALQGGRNPIQEIDQIRGVHNKGVLNKGKETFKAALQKDPTFGILLNGSSRGEGIVNKMWDTIERRVEQGANLTEVASEVVEHYRDVYGAYDEAVSSLPGFDAPGALGGAPGAASILSRLQPKAEPNFEDFAKAAAKDKSIDPVKEFLRATFGRGQAYEQVTVAD